MKLALFNLPTCPQILDYPIKTWEGQTVEWHLLKASFARKTFVQSIGNQSWLNLTFGQGSPSLQPFPPHLA